MSQSPTICVMCNNPSTGEITVETKTEATRFTHVRVTVVKVPVCDRHHFMYSFGKIGEYAAPFGFVLAGGALCAGKIEGVLALSIDVTLAVVCIGWSLFAIYTKDNYRRVARGKLSH